MLLAVSLLLLMYIFPLHGPLLKYPCRMKYWCPPPPPSGIKIQLLLERVKDHSPLYGARGCTNGKTKRRKEVRPRGKIMGKEDQREITSRDTLLENALQILNFYVKLACTSNEGL